MTTDERKLRTLHANLKDSELEQITQSLAPLTQVEGVRRVLMWFAGQDEVLRGLILGIIPKTVCPDVAKVILERIASKGKR